MGLIDKVSQVRGRRKSELLKLAEGVDSVEKASLFEAFFKCFKESWQEASDEDVAKVIDMLITDVSSEERSEVLLAFQQLANKEMNSDRKMFLLEKIIHVDREEREELVQNTNKLTKGSDPNLKANIFGQLSAIREFREEIVQATEKLIAENPDRQEPPEVSSFLDRVVDVSSKIKDLLKRELSEFNGVFILIMEISKLNTLEERNQLIEYIEKLPEGSVSDLSSIIRSLRRISIPEERNQVMEFMEDQLGEQSYILDYRDLLYYLMKINTHEERKQVIEYISELPIGERPILYGSLIVEALSEIDNPEERKQVMDLAKFLEGFLEEESNTFDPLYLINRLRYKKQGKEQIMDYLQANPDIAIKLVEIREAELFDLGVLLPDEMFHELLDELPASDEEFDQMADRVFLGKMQEIEHFILEKFDQITDEDKAVDFAKFIEQAAYGDFFDSIEEYQGELLYRLISILAISGEGDVRSPYRIYNRLVAFAEQGALEIECDKEIASYEIGGQEKRKEVSINPIGWKNIFAEADPIYFRDVPQEKDLGLLRQMYEDFGQRVETLEGDKKSDLHAAATLLSDTEDFEDFQVAMEAFLNTPYMQRLYSEQGEEDDRVSFEKAYLAKIIEYIDSLPVDVKEGEVLSERESAWISLLEAIQGCSAGQKTGIRKVYQGLPIEFQYNIRIKESSSEKEEVVKQIVCQVLIDLMTDVIGNPSLLRELCGLHPDAYITEDPHQSLYVRNILLPILGLQEKVEFDTHVGVLYESLIDKDPKEIFERALREIKPSMIAKHLKKLFDEKGELGEKGVAMQQKILEWLLEKSEDARAEEGSPEPFQHVAGLQEPSYDRYFLKEEGAWELLLQLENVLTQNG